MRPEAVGTRAYRVLAGPDRVHFPWGMVFEAYPIAHVHRAHRFRGLRYGNVDCRSCSRPKGNGLGCVDPMKPRLPDLSFA